MMKVEQIVLTEGNLVELINDKDVFGLTTSVFSERFTLSPLAECEIGKLLTGKIAVVRFLNE